MAQMAPMFSAIGNGAQAMFGTSALSGAGAGAAGGLGSTMASGAAAGTPVASTMGGISSGGGLSAMMESMPMGMGGGMGLFGSSGGEQPSMGMGMEDAQQMLGKVLMQQAMQGSEPGKMPELPSHQIQQAVQQMTGDRVRWNTPTSDPNSYINMLLSRGMQ